MFVFEPILIKFGNTIEDVPDIVISPVILSPAFSRYKLEELSIYPTSLILLSYTKKLSAFVNLLIGLI